METHGGTSLNSIQPLLQSSLNGALKTAAVDSTNLSAALNQLPFV